MELKTRLTQKRDAILGKWFDAVAGSYANDFESFLKQKKDPFTNPVGHRLRQALDCLLSAVTSVQDAQTITDNLDPFIRIRAAQNFPPSKATAFIFVLKDILRRELHKEISAGNCTGELLAMESKIDGLGLLAFDIYMQCREKLFEIKATEERNRTFKAFERAGLIKDEAASSPGTSNGFNST